MIRSLIHLLLFGLPFLTTGCGSPDLALDDAAQEGFAGDTSNDAVDDEDALRAAIRIDVEPLSPPTIGDEPLVDQAQSFWVSPSADWADQELRMRQTVLVSGEVRGFSANPWTAPDLSAEADTGDSDTGDPARFGPGGPSVPGSDSVPVIAEVRLYRPNTVVSQQVTTDESGNFTLEVPAFVGYTDDLEGLGVEEGYRLVVVPVSPADLPMYVEDDLVFTDNTRIDVELDYGSPVYGQVIDADGELVTGMTYAVNLIDVETGEEGPVAFTNAAGWYSLRALEGEYILQAKPVEDFLAYPTIRSFHGFDEDFTEARVDVNIGRRDLATLVGRLENPNGARLDDATVRLTSNVLENSEGSIAFEVQTDEDGVFDASVLPGSWTVEFVPPSNDTTASPFSQEIQVNNRFEDLGEITLPGRVVFNAQVLGIDGFPMPDVIINIFEDTFTGDVYKATTDDQGMITVTVPNTPMTAYLQPTNDNQSALTRIDFNPSDGLERTWALSEGQQVTGAVSVVGSNQGGLYSLTVRDSVENPLGILSTGIDGDFAFRVNLD
ncbi:MAG: hypothetical protein AAFV53_22705 [Myxococcota bacterium]